MSTVSEVQNIRLIETCFSSTIYGMTSLLLRFYKLTPFTKHDLLKILNLWTSKTNKVFYTCSKVRENYLTWHEHIDSLLVYLLSRLTILSLPDLCWQWAEVVGIWTWTSQQTRSLPTAWSTGTRKTSWRSPSGMAWSSLFMVSIESMMKCVFHCSSWHPVL